MKHKINIKDVLSQKGLKVTHQRLVIYDFLLRNQAHPTAEEVYHALRDDSPALSLGTVYKTLDTFNEKNLLSKVMLEDGKMRYDVNVHDHHHIILEESNEVIDFEDDEMKVLLTEYLRKKNIKNLKINDIRLHIMGSRLNPNEEVKLD